MKRISLVTLLLVSLCIPARAQKIGINLAINGGGKIAAPPSYAFTPQDIPGIQFWLPGAYSSAAYSEGGAGRGVTPTVNDGDSLGSMDLPVGPHFLATNNGSTDRPTWSTSNGRSGISFASASSQFMQVDNSKGAFNLLHDSTQTATVALWLQIANGNASTLTVMNSCTGSTQNGFMLQVTTGNKLLAKGSKSAGGITNVYSKQTTTGLVADGSTWNKIVIRLGGVGATTGSITINANAAETFAIVSGTTADATSNMFIGATTASASFLNGAISDLIVTNASTTDLTQWAGFNPARNSTSLFRQTVLTMTAPTQFSHCHTWWDTANIVGQWKDNTIPRVNAVAADGDTVGLLDSSAGPITLNRYCAQGTANQRPLYKTAIKNGKSCILFAGASGTGGNPNDLAFPQAFPRGQVTMFLVGSNTTSGSAAGTHHEASTWMMGPTQGGTSYFGTSGWLSSVGTTGNRCFWHSSSGAGCQMNNGFGMANVGGFPDWHVYDLQLTSTTADLFYDGLTTHIDAGDTTASTDILNWQHMGLNQQTVLDGTAPGYWDLSGYVAEVIIFNTALSSQMRALVRAYLKTKWGTP